MDKDKIAEELKDINKTLQKMLKVMEQPKNRAVRILEFFVLFAGALGTLNAADILRNWLIRG